MPSEFGDVVIIIPGIGGSVLVREGKEVWSPRPGAALRAVFSAGSTIKSLRLRGDDPDVDDVGDGVTATRLVPDLHVLPGIGWKIDGYSRLRKQLIDRLALRPGRNYFEFPYDWRRDNRVAARKLARNSLGWLKAWRTTDNPLAKLVLVGHSMGGIISRIFLECYNGFENTRMLVTFGTPYSGSMNALDFLSNGFRLKRGPITLELSDTIRSFTSVYQLLPSYRCLRMPDGSWEHLDAAPVPVPGLDQDKLLDALALHRNLRTVVDEHVANGYEGKGGYDIRPVLGDFQATGYSATLHETGVTVSNRREPEEEGGDGTVAKISAMPHELLSGWRNAAFMSEKHASLQNDAAVIDHLCGALLTIPNSPVNLFPANATPLAIEVNDAFLPEPVVVKAKTRDPGFIITGIATPVAGGAGLPVPFTADPDRAGGLRAELRGWPPGDYRLTVGGIGVTRVTDIFSIVDPAELVE